MDADEWGVCVARSTGHGSNIEVVRVDTAHGQAPHVDLLYLPPDEGVRKYDLDEKYGYGRVKQYLLAYWRRFAELYNRYHE